VESGGGPGGAGAHPTACRGWHPHCTDPIGLRSTG
jgi:hypothetical protein